MDQCLQLIIPPPGAVDAILGSIELLPAVGAYTCTCGEGSCSECVCICGHCSSCATCIGR